MKYIFETKDIIAALVYYFDLPRPKAGEMLRLEVDINDPARLKIHIEAVQSDKNAIRIQLMQIMKGTDL